MIKTSVFRKYAVFAVALTLALLALSLLATFMTAHYSRKSPDHTPDELFARLLSKAPSTGRSALLQHLNEATKEGHGPFLFALIDNQGRALPGSAPIVENSNIDLGMLPQEAFKTLLIKTNRFPAPPGGGIVRLEGTPAQYLLVKFNPKLGPPGPNMFFFTLLGVTASAVIAVFATLVALFSSLRRKARLADGVISELQNGNLKARFPITSVDEIGQAMQRFNRMADEIEHLVENTRRVERARNTLVQELAHDLRTPIASLKNLLETLTSRQDSLTPALRDEFSALAMKEVDYFARLIEDLLFLAQVSEPRYRKSLIQVDLLEVLRDEIETISAKHADCDVDLVAETKGLEPHVLADEHLLRRLVRNALENAFSFARKKIEIAVQFDGGQIRVAMNDDGPGFSDEALLSFGERRITRAVNDESAGGRVSVGLGSVIMRSVAESLRGTITALNIEASPGSITGARLVITLPSTDKV